MTTFIKSTKQEAVRQIAKRQSRSTPYTEKHTDLYDAIKRMTADESISLEFPKTPEGEHGLGILESSIRSWVVRNKMSDEYSILTAKKSDPMTIWVVRRDGENHRDIDGLAEAIRNEKGW